MHDQASVKKFLTDAADVATSDWEVVYVIITQHNATGSLSARFYRTEVEPYVTNVRETVQALGRHPDRTVIDVFFTNKSLVEQVDACARELFLRSAAAA